MDHGDNPSRSANEPTARHPTPNRRPSGEPTPEMAARAHDVASIACNGGTGKPSFPDSAWALPRARSESAEDVRCAYRIFESPLTLRTEKNQCGGTTEEDGAVEFVDEEALLDLPGLLNGMAEGMMLTPPAMKRGFDWDGVEGHMDLSLWND